MLSNLKKITAAISAAVMMIVGIAAFTPTAEASVSQDIQSELLIKELSVLVNEAREKAGLEPLYLTPIVSSFAEKRAVELADYFSHVRPDGDGFETIIDYEKLPFTYISENIAAGHCTAEGTFEQLKNSPSHWEAIMNPKFTHIGIGIYYDPDSYFGWYWSQLFVRIKGELDDQQIITREDFIQELHTVFGPNEIIPQGWGDLNGDGHVNSYDQIILIKHIFDETNLNELQLKYADVLADGEINIADIVVMRKYILGAYESLPLTPSL